MEEPINRQQILEEFLNNIVRLSDEKYQQRVWVNAQGPECNDIDDAVCDFFDEDYILDKYKDFDIRENQYQLLIELRNKLRKFTDTFGVYSPYKSTEELIKLPEWQEIRELARQILAAFGRDKTK